MDYKRYFIYSSDGDKVVTIWMKLNQDCYIIPGKYYSPFSPSKNYIKTVNHKNYVGLLFNTKDKYDYKISVYNQYQLVSLNSEVKVYSDNDSLRLEYGMLDSLNVQSGIWKVNPKEDSLSKSFDYKYIDLNRVYGIKIFD